MKSRWIAIALTLTSVFGLFGCAFTADVTENKDGAVPQGFLSAEADAALSVTSDNAEYINVAELDEEGKPLFQIVYAIGAGLRVQEQCEMLAASIYEETGVTLPVVHSSEMKKTHEITVGEVKRVETIDVIDEFELEDTDFAICAVGTRIVIYAESDAALVSGMLFFTEQSVYRNPLQGLYGLDTDYRFVYHPNENPTVALLESDDARYVELSLETGPSMYTYVRLSYTGNKGWRIQTKYRERDAYRDTGASQLLAYTLGEHELGTEDERFYLEDTSSSRVGDILTVTSEDGGRVEIDLSDFQMDFYTESNKLASSITGITHNAGNSSITGILEEDEAIFGTGERFNGANQRGKKIEMFTKDIWSRADACYMVIPLLSFSRGSGVFLNNYEHMMLDLDSKRSGTWSAVITGAPIDCYVFTTEKIAEVIKGYSELSGYANMPEEWTYGMLVCGYGADLSTRWTSETGESNGEGIYECIAMMEAYDLPWTGILAEPWGGYRYMVNHAELKELCDYVHSLGKKFILYMRVGFASASLEGFETSYWLTQTRMDGSKNYNLPNTSAGTNNPDLGTGVKTFTYLDFTDPQAAEWFYNEYWDYLTNEIGADGCKIDFCEMLPENFKLNYFDENVPTAGSHHWYPTAFCARFYDMLAKKPDGGMCYTRGGGIGSQRAPYMWAGDQVRSWNGIQWQLTGTVTSGLSGVPFMSYDMSGYKYDYNDPMSGDIAYEASVFVRGTQYSAYTICVQTHGTVRRSYVFAEYEDESGAHPYTYATEIYRAYTKLHEHLTPYITELSEEACETGMPVVRHLVLGWQEDKNVYGMDDEFTLGDAFLVAPIFTDGETRTVYLPKGTWEDLNTGDVHEVGAEGKTIEVSANVAELPTFFNVNTESEIARELVDGIKEIYDYARTLAPAE